MALRASRSVGALALNDYARSDQVETLQWQRTTGGCMKTKKSQDIDATNRQVLSIEELKIPFSPWLAHEQILVRESDLHRCGDNLDLLKDCANGKLVDINMEPRPSPKATSIGTDRNVPDARALNSKLQSLERPRDRWTVDRWSTKDPLPRVLGRWSMDKTRWSMPEKVSMKHREKRALHLRALRSPEGGLRSGDSSGANSALSTARTGASGASTRAPSSARCFESAERLPSSRSMTSSGRVSPLPSLRY